jgi:hypothetical protein
VTPTRCLLLGIAGVYKPGGMVLADTARLLDCIETTKLHYAEVAELLQQALADAEVE